MNGKIKILSLLLLVSLVLFSCNREKTGKLAIRFTASVDDNPLTFNEMIYQNALGNHYSVDEVKYFISDLMIVDKEGKWFHLQRDKEIYYVDHAIVSTLKWQITDYFPVGEYRSLSFIFGLSQEKNVSNFFVNSPETNMAWPLTLGGGYHYMQINGKWSEEVGGVENPLNIHTGISRIITPDSLIRYEHNFFTVSFSDIKFEMQEDKTTEVILNMNINQWFTNPENQGNYDFKQYGTGIMANDTAQKILKENGINVFSFSRNKIEFP